MTPILVQRYVNYNLKIKPYYIQYSIKENVTRFCCVFFFGSVDIFFYCLYIFIYNRKLRSVRSSKNQK